MKKFLLSLMMSLGLVSGAAAAGSSLVPMDKFPAEKLSSQAALQNGAKLFVNNCLNCHAAAFMRYNRMRDIGLTEQQIKENLMFATDKVGDTMKVSMDPQQAKAWFGGVPPDLTVIARSRAGHGYTGADYLYSYLRNFYRDPEKATGWNNLTFPGVGMPHVLWEMQGQRTARFEEQPDPKDSSKKIHQFVGFDQVTPGTLGPQEFDSAMGDLVAFLQWMGEPAQQQRQRLGVWVLLFLAVFAFFAWRLNLAYWKDIK